MVNELGLLSREFKSSDDVSHFVNELRIVGNRQRALQLVLSNNPDSLKVFGNCANTPLFRLRPSAELPLNVGSPGMSSQGMYIHDSGVRRSSKHH